MFASLAAVALGAVSLQPCEIHSQPLECGTVQVPENRALPQGRQIELRFAVHRSKAGGQQRDAIAVLGGGPGQAATDLAPYAIELFKDAGRDILMLDARGTGGSHPLRCEFGGSDADPGGFLNDFLPLERVAACKAALERKADLTQYTTRAIVEDLEAVREKLGYAQLDLFGTSYGTRVAQEFMRNHPRRVRIAILDGVVPPNLVIPVPYPATAQQALESVLAACAADESCRAAYPNLRADYAAMLSRIANGVEVSTGSARFTVHRGMVGEAFRNFLYSPELYTRVPGMLNRAAQGDFREFGENALRYARGIRTLYFGMYLSVSCTEDFPRFDLEAARAQAKGTLLGSYRAEQQAAACAIWPRGTPDPQRTQPVKSAIPTLLVSGEFDPVTPPQYAEEVAKSLSNARHVVVPKGSHGNDSAGCVDRILTAAVKLGSVRRLDVSCVERLPSPEFLLGSAEAGDSAAQ